jgi:Transmembrane amino acid transporter protein
MHLAARLLPAGPWYRERGRAGGARQGTAATTTARCASSLRFWALVGRSAHLREHARIAELKSCTWHQTNSCRKAVLPCVLCVQLSLAGHSTYPSVRASMAQPHRFAEALNWAYLVMFAILGAITTCGYWYWGSLAHTLVTEDFETHSPYVRFTIGNGFGIHKCVEALVVLNMLTRVPLFVLSLQDLGHSFFLEARGGAHSCAAGSMAPVRAATFDALAGTVCLPC